MVITTEQEGEEEGEEEKEEGHTHVYLYFNLCIQTTTRNLSLSSSDYYDDDDGRGGGGEDGDGEGGEGGGGTDITDSPYIGFEYGEGEEVGRFEDLYEGVGENGVDGEGGVAEGGGTEGGKKEAGTIHSSHQQRRVMLGDRFRLKCRPQNVMSAPPQDFEAEWYFNSQPLRDSQTSRIRIIASR